jgi:hypothetical protein
MAALLGIHFPGDGSRMHQKLPGRYSWWIYFLAGEIGKVTGFATLQIIGTATVAQVSVDASWFLTAFARSHTLVFSTKSKAVQPMKRTK